MASTEKRNHCVIIASGWLKSNFKKPSKRQQHYSEYLLVNGLFTWKIETTCIRRKNYLKKKLAKRGIGFYKLSISIIVPAFPPPFLALQPWFPAFPPWFLASHLDSPHSHTDSLHSHHSSLSAPRFPIPAFTDSLPILHDNKSQTFNNF